MFLGKKKRVGFPEGLRGRRWYDPGADVFSHIPHGAGSPVILKGAGRKSVVILRVSGSWPSPACHVESSWWSLGLTFLCPQGLRVASIQRCSVTLAVTQPAGQQGTPAAKKGTQREEQLGFTRDELEASAAGRRLPKTLCEADACAVQHCRPGPERPTARRRWPRRARQPSRTQPRGTGPAGPEGGWQTHPEALLPLA